MNCPKSWSLWLVSHRINLVLILPKPRDLLSRISYCKPPLKIHTGRLHLGSWSFSSYHSSLVYYDILFVYISIVLAWGFELSLNIWFFKVLSIELNPWIVSLLSSDPLESLLLFMSVSLPFLCLAFFQQSSLVTLYWSPTCADSWQCPGCTLPDPSVPLNLWPMNACAVIRKPSPHASGWDKLWSAVYVPALALRDQAEAWFCLKSYLAWLLPLPCLASSLESESCHRVYVWDPRPKTPSRAFADLSIKKSLTQEQAFFCFTYTFSHSSNCSESGMTLFQWDHIGTSLCML